MDDHAVTRRERRYTWVISLLAVTLLATIIGSLSLGRYPIGPLTIGKILLAMLVKTGGLGSDGWSDTEFLVIESVRFPRVMLATLSGMGLATSGAALQGLFRNPLVGPEVVGVTAGASFGGVAAILLALPMAGIVVCAFAGGMLSLFLAYSMARLAGRSSVLSLILSGVIVSAFFSALNGLAQYVADPTVTLPSMIYWLLGSFVGADWRKVLFMAAVMGGAGSLLLALRWRINLLSLGELDASALGERVEWLRWLVVALVAVIVATQVAVSGGIGWIGLVVPHFARLAVGPDHRLLLPVSALMGGIYLLAMDDLARILTTQEIPIGLLTALVGTPVFGYVFWRSRSNGWSHD